MDETNVNAESTYEERNADRSKSTKQNVFTSFFGKKSVDAGEMTSSPKWPPMTIWSVLPK